VSDIIKGATTYVYANDLTLSKDGHLLAGSWTQAPGVFSYSDTRPGVFTLDYKLGSQEAVRLRVETPGGGSGPAASAATIGVAVLAVADRQSGVAEEVAERWAARLAELRFRPPVVPVTGRAAGTTQASL